MNPFEMRDKLNPLCPRCNKPIKQTAIPISHRGNFQHGCSVLKVKLIGECCQCGNYEGKPTPDLTGLFQVQAQAQPSTSFSKMVDACEEEQQQA